MAGHDRREGRGKRTGSPEGGAESHLISAGVEEVAQAHNVAVVQLAHDLQLSVLALGQTHKQEDTRA